MEKWSRHAPKSREYRSVNIRIRNQRLAVWTGSSREAARYLEMCECETERKRERDSNTVPIMQSIACALFAVATEHTIYLLLWRTRGHTVCTWCDNYSAINIYMNTIKKYECKVVCDRFSWQQLARRQASLNLRILNIARLARLFYRISHQQSGKHNLLEREGCFGTITKDLWVVNTNLIINSSVADIKSDVFFSMQRKLFFHMRRLTEKYSRLKCMIYTKDALHNPHVIGLAGLIATDADTPSAIQIPDQRVRGKSKSNVVCISTHISLCLSISLSYLCMFVFSVMNICRRAQT